jgi:hypothetical protein
MGLADIKSARRHEKDASQLRDRLGEVEPLLTETQQERIAMQKQADQQRTERTELLLRVFKDINKFLGSEVSYLLPLLLLNFWKRGAE